MSETDLSSLLPFLPTSLRGKKVLHVIAKENNNGTTMLFLNDSVAKLTVLRLNSSSVSTDVAYTNVEYLNSNLGSLELGSNQFDLVYVSSSVLGSLTNEDVQTLTEKALQSLNISASNDTGFLLFSDVSCQSKRTSINYIDLVESRIIENPAEGNKLGYTLIFVKPNQSTSFLFQKIKLTDFHGYKTLRDFMDNKQYSRRGVLTYEKIFGSGFVSTGGSLTTERFVNQYIKPSANQRLLDVGCGIGGGDFYIAEKYGVEVFGMDLSSNMISIAWERVDQHPNAKVAFEIGDITKQKFPDESFDIIYSRDTILHIADKEALFTLFRKWLKPGGKIFISDYCAGPRDKWSGEFKAYVDQRGYDLREISAYGKIFSDLGFRNVQAVDATDMFVECLNLELVRMNEIKETFVSEFSQKDFDYLVEGWSAKLVRCANGDQKWGIFYCEK